MLVKYKQSQGQGCQARCMQVGSCSSVRLVKEIWLTKRSSTSPGILHFIVIDIVIIRTNLIHDWSVLQWYPPSWLLLDLFHRSLLSSTL